MKQENPVYSYHTFLYPFLCRNEAKSLEFADLFEASEHWKKDFWNTEQTEDPHLGDRLCYQSFQYFNVSARRALFEEEAEDKIVRSFCFQPCGQGLEGIYEIHPPANAFQKQAQPPLLLRLNAIRLKIYNTGVAVMVYETEYRPDPTVPLEQRRANVKYINEYGRRLYPEYLPAARFPAPYTSSMLCAEKIAIRLLVGGTEITIHDDFRTRAERHLSDREEDQAQSYIRSPIFLPDIVGRILNYGLEQEKIHCRRTDHVPQGTFRIEPAIDDRMFVCCAIRDSKYVEQFVGYPSSSSGYQMTHPHKPKGEYLRQRQAHDWKFRTDWLTGQELYAVVNVDDNVADPEGSSCQNRESLDQYLDEQLYLRWIEYGTIHAVTNHSLFCLTSEDIDADHVVNSFLILYVQMCILTVVQRASLLSFDARITKCVSPAQGQKKTLGHDTRKVLYDIAEDFAVFQGQILISEVTPQIQGIEIYEKLQKMLFIDPLERNVQQQLNNLFQIARSRQEDERLKNETKRNNEERKQDTTIARIGILFSVITIPSFLIDLFQYIGSDIDNFWLISLVSAISLLSIGFIVIKKRGADEKEDTDEFL